MESNRSVYERLDSIEKQNSINEAQNAEILSLLKDINSKQVPTQQSIPLRNQLSEKEMLTRFVRSSKKEFIWFGPTSEFSKSKNILTVVCISLLVVAVLSTILTSIASGIYTTFTLLENLWAVATCFVLSHCLHSKKRISDLDLSSHSCYKFMQNEDGTWVDTNKEKKRYRWIRRLSYVAVIANIICIWMNSTGPLAIFATIAELAFVGLSIALFFVYINLFCMYNNIVVITGKQVDGDKIVSIVFDTMSKKLVPYEEFVEKFKTLIE